MHGGFGRWGGLGDLMGGFERRLPSAPESYEEYFKAYSMARSSARQRNDVSYGGKILMPPSALATIST